MGANDPAEFGKLNGGLALTLFFAAMSGQFECLDALLTAGAAVGCKYPGNDYVALHIAAHNGHDARVRRLLAAEDRVREERERAVRALGIMAAGRCTPRAAQDHEHQRRQAHGSGRAGCSGRRP